MDSAQGHPLSSLLALAARLRAADGCPWDRAQTTASMAPFLLEEAAEAYDALAKDDLAHAREELGDVLINVALIAQIASERGGFRFEDAAAQACDKLVRRHPHVFGPDAGRTADGGHASWEEIKHEERRARGGESAVRADMPAAMPGLLRALRIGEQAAKVGFDWPDRHGPRRKLDEELGELEAAVAAGDQAAVAAELGDVLFSVVNLARHLGCDPEAAVRGAADRFSARFRRVQEQLGDLQGKSLDEMEAAWQRAKQDLDRRPGPGPRNGGAQG